jgi:hypothetical protein
MKRIVSLLVVVCAALFARPVHAGPLDVSATISGVAAGARLSSHETDFRNFTERLGGEPHFAQH